jgi:hypothetical protein
MRLFMIGKWHFHFEVDWNIWLIGVSWNTVPQYLMDVGLYLGPMNLQIEKYDRRTRADPWPSDPADDPFAENDSENS